MTDHTIINMTSASFLGSHERLRPNTHCPRCEMETAFRHALDFYCKQETRIGYHLVNSDSREMIKHFFFKL